MRSWPSPVMIAMLKICAAGSIVLSLSAAQAQLADRTYESDWYVSDITNNNTGEREVYAFQTYLDRLDYVSLYLRCSNGVPAFFVEWDDVAFPNPTVLTISPVAGPDSETAVESYMFEKGKDVLDRGLRASPETSEKIIAAIGEAKYLTVTAHLSSGNRIVRIEVDGTQRAWSRVSRHCPVRIMARPLM